MARSVALSSSRTPSGVGTRIEGYKQPMERDIKSGGRPEEREAIRKESEEAREGDKELDEYDKAVADSFPAGDPPAQP